MLFKHFKIIVFIWFFGVKSGQLRLPFFFDKTHLFSLYPLINIIFPRLGLS